MKDLVIQYKDITITKRNIAKYKAEFMRGQFNSDSNVITIFRYTLDKKTPLAINDNLRCLIKDTPNLEPTTLIHEFKHFQNQNYLTQHPYIFRGCFYECCGLYVFDEVSAYATAHIAPGEPATLSQVCRAVSAGIDDFLYNKDLYMPAFMQIIAQELNDFNKTNPNVVCRNTQKILNLPKRHSHYFIKTVDAFLTFNGQGIRYSNNKIPSRLQKRIQELTQVYEVETYKTMRTELKKLQKTK